MKAVILLCKKIVLASVVNQPEYFIFPELLVGKSY